MTTLARLRQGMHYNWQGLREGWRNIRERATHALTRITQTHSTS